MQVFLGGVVCFLDGRGGEGDRDKVLSGISNQHHDPHYQIMLLGEIPLLKQQFLIDLLPSCILHIN